MSIKALTPTMQFSGTVEPERLGDLFASLGDVFVPFDLSFSIGDDPIVRIARESSAIIHGMHLWSGEHLGSTALTRCPPQPGRELVGELGELLNGRTGAVWARAVGALRHRAGRDETPEWYGHWASTKALRELVEVRIECSDEAREFEMIFPLQGYPLTPNELRDDFSIADGSNTLAAANRELLLPALTRVRDALGFAREQVDWSIQGDAGWHHSDVAAELEELWLPRFRG